MNALDKIAPYPASEKEATAAAMARCYTAYAQLHFRISLDHHDRDQAARSSRSFVSCYGLAYLLRELEKHAGAEAANEVARNLWAEQDAGDGMGEWVWEWLEEYGIDPEAVNKIAEEATTPNPDAGTQAGTCGAA